MNNSTLLPSDKPIRVCHIAATTEGATWMVEQLRDLRDRYGYEVAAILSGDQGKLVDKLNAEGIPVFSTDFDFISSGELLQLPRKVIQLIRLLRKEKFDIVQTHLFHSMVIGRISAWMADVPVRFSMIAGPFHLEAYTPRWIDRYTSWLDTSIIASCEYTRRLYLDMGVPETSVENIYYGPDEKKFDPVGVSPADLRGELGWGPDVKIIGLVAYFYPELPANRWISEKAKGSSVKRQEDLIKAIPIIASEFPGAKVLFIGSGWESGGQEYLSKMHKLVDELGVRENVKFLGYRTDIAQTLMALDVSVQCAISENLGGTIESLLMTCPTVATRVGGMTDSVVDGVSGVLVNPLDPASLAEGILRLLRDPAAAKRLGVAGRERMLSGFTLRHTVDRLSALYLAKYRRASQGYRWYVMLWRLIVGGILCTFIAIRFVLLDVMLLPRWDMGWRPWSRNVFSIMPGYHKLLSWIGRTSAKFSIRSYCRKVFSSISRSLSRLRR